MIFKVKVNNKYSKLGLRELINNIKELKAAGYKFKAQHKRHFNLGSTDYWVETPAGPDGTHRAFNMYVTLEEEV